jgi:glycosyltransferase involved in cell wall biosynthesis
MRILIATCNRAIVGGVEKYLHAVIPALAERGHQVAILYENACSSEKTMVDPPNQGIPIWMWPDIQTNSGLWRDISAWRPDVVYSHMSQSLEIERYLLDHYPVVIYAHNYLGTCITGSKSHAIPHRRPCNRHFGPMCLVMHHPRRCGGLNPFRAWQMYQSQVQRNSRLLEYRAILVASKHMYREFEDHGVAEDRLRLAPLPLTESTTQVDPPLPRIPGGNLVFVGRLTNLKGVDYLIRAIPKAAESLRRSLTLTVLGDGPELTRLQRLGKTVNVSIKFAGWVESTQKAHLLRQADLLVVPSLWPEPFGLVGLEAASLGIPAVAYAVGGIPDWLIPGETGELASGDPPTVEGLAESIVRALRDQEHYVALCRGAWALANNFTMCTHVTQLEEILRGNMNAQGSLVTSFTQTDRHEDCAS